MGVAGLALELKFSPSALDFLGEGNDPRGENAPPITGQLKRLSGNDSNRRRCFPFVFPPPLFSSFVFKIKADSTVVVTTHAPPSKNNKTLLFFHSFIHSSSKYSSGFRFVAANKTDPRSHPPEAHVSGEERRMRKQTSQPRARWKAGGGGKWGRGGG